MNNKKRELSTSEKSCQGSFYEVTQMYPKNESKIEKKWRMKQISMDKPPPVFPVAPHAVFAVAPAF